MSRNTLIAVIVLLLLVIAVGGYLYWQESQRNTVSIELGNDGLTIQTP